jgi:hypothetical protein
MKKLLPLFIFFVISQTTKSQYSVARRWNEVQLAAIRQDLARPPIQARNLFHVSMAMYDAWAAYKPTTSSTYLLGKTINNQLYAYTGALPLVANDTLASQNMAISYAAYRVLRQRYAISPNATAALYRFDTLMTNLGYDIDITSTNYTTGTPADLGNYIAEQITNMGLADGANESFNYNNNYYTPLNPYLYTSQIGSSGMLDPNRWQPLNIVTAIDQNGNPVSSNQNAICPEWGNVFPFSFDPNSATTHTRDGYDYKLYVDPGGPSFLDTSIGNDASSMHYKWANEMVAVWSSMLDPNDNTMIDISPKAKGNLTTYPITLNDQYSYYNYFQGGDNSIGYTLNPYTNLPYAPQMVKLGDYTRVVSQYWADGPQSETPPGHWYVVLNKVSDHPLFVKKYKGLGPTLSDLEWDIKSYFVLGGAIHDAAIAAWSLKGWYDSPRPISAIRKMAEYGQSSDSNLPHYHKAGLPLIPGYIELVTATDSLATVNATNIDKIKIKAWRGHDFISDPNTDVAGVGWILAENWMPYQSKTFVTPPFAGYVSGHSTYSRAGAEIMASITGSAFFPGGIYETVIGANSNFLKFENGPSTIIKLQWATYLDASNEASLSRIWGGIHAPSDDAHGRAIGKQIAIASVLKADQYFTPITLPVNLISFAATEKYCEIQLQWITDRETNAKQFELWRSEDGITYTQKIAIIAAKNSYTNTSIYNTKDPLPNKSNFYRLIEIDLDGKKTILAHKHVRLSNCKASIAYNLSIYPNPVLDKLNLQLTSKNTTEKATLKVIDVLGQVAYSGTVKVINGLNRYSIPLQNRKAGNYIIQLTNENGQITALKFVKLN